MADTVSAEQRSRNMSRIRSKNTKPELKVRRLLHRSGYRFRLHGAAAGGSLPGKPDLVFAGRRKVIFVNGCFWHTHSCPAGTHAPATNPEFWAAKRARTVERDEAALRALASAGWEALVVWECELRDPSALETELAAFLGAPGQPASVDSADTLHPTQGISDD
ncbi:very short patch repair endonuclease [Arthrobacter koreensis]|uniref:Very short patch repair endonuclease n=1 Tax=Arthrobacter koreensis TaxID=199136 RepID=A0ABY6FTZ7_9MICC|nr:very short patch repair endonuclease [Arthrobacter koreensis]UYB36706.1 very short patch repair endonuclease [Arthrobacter koreensis]